MTAIIVDEWNGGGTLERRICFEGDSFNMIFYKVAFILSLYEGQPHDLGNFSNQCEFK